MEDVNFVPDNINKLYVKLSIKRDVDIPSGSTVEIVSSDLLGTKSIVIDPTSSAQKAKDGDTLIGIAGKAFNPDKNRADSLVIHALQGILTTITKTQADTVPGHNK